MDAVSDEAGAVVSRSIIAIFVLVSHIPAPNDCVCKRFLATSLWMQRRVRVLNALAPVDRINNLLNTR